MQIPPVPQPSRQQLQDEVLTLIRGRTGAAGGAARPSQEPLAAEKAAAPVGTVQTDEAVRETNETLKVLATSLKFEVDDDSGRTVVKVLDRDSGEVLRQIPSEAALQIARSLDRLVGHLVNHAT